jgi:hypothetical protein
MGEALQLPLAILVGMCQHRYERVAIGNAPDGMRGKKPG